MKRVLAGVKLLDLLTQLCPNFLILDGNFCIVTISDSFAKSLGYEPTALIDYSVFCLLTPASQEWLKISIKIAAEKPTKQTASIDVILSGDRISKIPLSLLALIDDDGTLYLLIDESKKT